MKKYNLLILVCCVLFGYMVRYIIDKPFRDNDRVLIKDMQKNIQDRKDLIKHFVIRQDTTEVMRNINELLETQRDIDYIRNKLN